MIQRRAGTVPFVLDIASYDYIKWTVKNTQYTPAKTSTHNLAGPGAEQ